MMERLLVAVIISFVSACEAADMTIFYCRKWTVK